MRLPEDFNIDSTHPPLFPYIPPPKQTKPAFAYPPIFLSKHSIWFSENLSLREEYKNRVARNYNVEFFPTDFSLPSAVIQDTMNGWLQKVLQGTSPPVTSVFPRDTQFWFLQSLYFKAHWKQKFQHSYTKERPFTLITGESITVPTMYEDAFNFPYSEDEEVQVLEMPYFAGDSGEFSMVLFLPKAKDGITQFEAGFDVARYETLMNALHDTNVIVFIPKFRIEQETDLTAIAGPGFWDRFDFSGMIVPGAILDNARAIQKISMGIDEHGTEITLLAEIGYVSLGNEVPIFRADHPFMFVIREMQTGAILFMGRVMDPR